MKRIEIIVSLCLIALTIGGGMLLGPPAKARAPVDCVPLKDLPFDGGGEHPVAPLGITWASEYAPAKFWAGVFVAILVLWHWWHVRPCDNCGEYRQQCRCKAPEHNRKRGS